MFKRRSSASSFITQHNKKKKNNNSIKPQFPYGPKKYTCTQRTILNNKFYLANNLFECYFNKFSRFAK